MFFFVCASALTVVSAGCRRLPQPTAGTLPRKRLASSAAGGASALSSSPAPKTPPYRVVFFCVSLGAHRRPHQKEYLIRQDGVFFLEMCCSAGEIAASTCAKRAKSGGETGFLRMATAIRGMPGSEFKPRRPLRKKKDTQGCLLVRQQNQNFWNRLSICTGHTSYPFFLS